MAKPPKRAPLERVVDRLTGARLCYGEPVQVGATAVIPVSRVRVYGGLGYGAETKEGDGGPSSGGGGGGFLDATPIGYIELRSDGTRYVELPDGERSQRIIRAGATAAATLLAAAATARRLRGGRPARRLGR